MAAPEMPSDARLLEVYGPAGRYPTIAQTAVVLGVSPRWVRRRLATLGVLRGRREQIRLGYATGRRVSALKGRSFPPPKGKTPEHITRLIRAGQARATRRKAAEALRRRVVMPCIWCGLPVERREARSNLARFGFACDKRCAGRGSAHNQHHRDEPRPLILEKLRELLKDRTPTYENAAKQAEKIGAREPEILAAIG